MLIGTGHSPRWEDDFGFLLNGVCFSFCLVLIILGFDIIPRIHTHWTHLGLVILLLPVAAVQAHPYLTAWDALRNAGLDADLNVPGPFATEIRSVWTEPPRHNGRVISNKDFNNDRQEELLVIDRYTWPGSSRDKVITIGIYQVEDNTYSLVFSQSVSEGRSYSFYEGCPKKSSYLGSHSSIYFLNLDSDSQVEIFVHEAQDSTPPYCRFDYYYDWKDGVARYNVQSCICW